jgi:hypothetical protein
MFSVPPDELPFFVQVEREQAQRVCVTVAEYNLIMFQPQMAHEIAAELASAWLSHFDEHATFFVNGESALAKRPGLGGARCLFHTDMEAGVIAVTPPKVGLFGAAEDS